MNAADARERIEEFRHQNAFISLTDEDGDGLVVAVKDLIDVRGTVTTGGGIILPAEPAAEDAPLIQRVREAGCVIIGKTNLYEWAYGVSSANPYYGDVPNPRDPSRSAGGSSSGSAVAVAAGMCDWAIGTDTAGSIRVPASLCGVVGFKPSFGTIGTQGVIPLSKSLDTVGSLAPSVQAAACAVEIMSGLSELIPKRVPSVDELRLATPTGWVTGLDGDTSGIWNEVASGLSEIAFPDHQRMVELATTIQSAEASAFHRAWMERCPDRYSPEVLARLRAGLEIRAADYLSALDESRGLAADVARIMNDWDAILLPATAVVAPSLQPPEIREPLIRFTRPFNLSGQPVIVVPARTTGLPVGIQVIGAAGRDEAVVRVALALERAWNCGADAS